MKAAVLCGLGKLEIRNIDKPTIMSGSILIKVKSCGICGSDIRFFDYGDRRITYPRILGHEVAGEVVEIGSDVVNFQVGDRVALASEVPCNKCEFCKKDKGNLCNSVISLGTMIDGGLAEYLILDKTFVKNGPINKIPDNLGYNEASIAEPLGCVVNGLETVGTIEGKTILIVGAGPIGCMFINLSRILGSSKIIIVDREEKRLTLARGFNADYYINSSDVDLLEEVKKLTQNSGVDIAISACSSVNVHEQAIKSLKKGGIANIFAGVPKSERDITISTNLLHYNCIKVVGSFSSTKRHHKMALDYISERKIKTKQLITHTFKLNEILKAINTVKNQDALKIIVNP